MPHNIEPKTVVEYFSQHGKISEYFSGRNNKFLIIQFQEVSTAENVLKAVHIINGRRLNVKPRIVKEKHTGPSEIKVALEDYETITKELKTETSFDGQLRILLHHVQPSWPVMLEKYRHLCHDLQVTLRKAFPDCVVHPFGSTVTGLAFNSSDVDVYVKIHDSENILVSTLINKSKKVLGQSNLFSHIVGIPRAKTPIVKCVHVPTNISCDFNFKNMLGVCNSKLIHYYLSLHPKLTPLMVIIKYWAQVHSVCGGQKFSKYSLVLLLIFYLQQEPFNFPSVWSLQKESECLDLQEGWNGNFFPCQNFDNTAVKNHTLEQLLAGFFNFYCSFDFIINIVCPYLGKVVSKMNFLKTENLPCGFERYKLNIPIAGCLKVESPICVQDPFEHSRNTVVGVSVKCLEEFVALCSMGAKIFDANEKSGNLLYRLFTELPDVNSFYKCIFSDNESIFKISMGNCLRYLEKSLGNQKQSEVETISKAWYDIVSRFVLSVFADVLKFDVKAVKDSLFSKSLKLEGQTDVYDTNNDDTVCFECSGTYNLWEARKSIAKDLHLEYPQDSTIIDREILLTNYICDVLYEKITLNECVIKFMVTLTFKSLNEVQVHLKNIKSYKSNFKTLSQFCTHRLPVWFATHEKELNSSVSDKDKDFTNDIE